MSVHYLELYILITCIIVMCVYVSTIQSIEKYISQDQCLACNNVLYNNSVFLLSVQLTSHVVYTGWM